MYEKEDEKRIVAFLKTIFPIWPPLTTGAAPLEYWRWKYLDNPVMKDKILNTPKVAVCEHLGEIIAVTHTLPFMIKIGENIHFGSIGPDFAVHIDHRRKGISKLTSDYSDSQTQPSTFYYSITDNPILVKRNKRRRYPQFPHELRTYVIIYDIDKHLKNTNESSLSKKYGYLALKKIRSLKNILSKNPKNPDITTIERFEINVNEFWDKIKNNYKFILKRDQKYLNWRYCDPRGGKYTVQILKNGKSVQGYSVLAINDNNPNYPMGVIVDLMATNTNDAQSLVQNSVKYFNEKSLNIIKIRLIKGHPYSRAINQLGFVDTTIHPYETYQILKPIPEDLSLFHSSKPYEIHHVYGDLDTI